VRNERVLKRGFEVVKFFCEIIRNDFLKANYEKGHFQKCEMFQISEQREEN